MAKVKARKTAAKKAAPKKAAAKKTAPKKTAPKKTAPKKAVPKKTAAKKTAKKAAPTKTTPKNAAAKTAPKSAPTKTASAKTAPKSAPTKKAPTRDDATDNPIATASIATASIATASTDVRWRDLLSILDLPYDDPRVLDVVHRLGKTPPTPTTTLMTAQPFGVLIDFGEASEVCSTQYEPETVLAQGLIVHVNSADRSAGLWEGDLPPWLTRDATPDSLAHRGTLKDAGGQAEIVVIDNGLEVTLTFADDLYRIDVYPAAYREGRKRRYVDHIVDRFGPDGLANNLGPYVDDPSIWDVIEQRIGAEATAAIKRAPTS